MTRIDQFESVFKAAARTPFTYERVEVRKVLVITDLETPQAARFGERLRAFLAVLDGDGPAWVDAPAKGSRTIGDLLELVQSEAPDLICTYRNLHSGAWRWPHSLGDQLDVLTQATEAPVLVMPRPEAEAFYSGALNTDSVVAITDHLAGDARLVRWAARFTQSGGTLCLTHIEDETIFERYIEEVIGKIPEIDTETARREIGRRLLKEPEDYIVSCKEVLRREQLPIELQRVVAFGHRLADVERLIGERRVDLLVLNTKDEDQLAMHGLAYPLAVQLRSTPLLML